VIRRKVNGVTVVHTQHDEGMVERLDGVRVYGSSDSYVCPISAFSSFGKQNAIPVSLQAGRSTPCRPNPAATLLVITSDKGGGTCFARVRLSVCLLARLLKNAFMDLHEMLRVDRCRDMDELINFSARSVL